MACHSTSDENQEVRMQPRNVSHPSGSLKKYPVASVRVWSALPLSGRSGSRNLCCGRTTTVVALVKSVASVRHEGRAGATDPCAVEMHRPIHQPSRYRQGYEICRQSHRFLCRGMTIFDVRCCATICSVPVGLPVCNASKQLSGHG